MQRGVFCREMFVVFQKAMQRADTGEIFFLASTFKHMVEVDCLGSDTDEKGLAYSQSTFSLERRKKKFFIFFLLRIKCVFIIADLITNLLN